MRVGMAAGVIDTDVLGEHAELGRTHRVKRLQDEPAMWGTVEAPTEEWARYGPVHVVVDTPRDYLRLTGADEGVDDEPGAVAFFRVESGITGVTQSTGRVSLFHGR
jgi:hypothetical protein